MKAEIIIQKAGGPTVVANLFGITSQAVSQWRVIPANRVLVLEQHLGKSITRYQMRPDIHGKKAA